MHRSFKPPAIAALLYVATWIVGLSIWPANPSVTSSRHEIVTAYAGHRALATAQFVLVEGLAAVALACVVLALAPRVRAIGLTACAISLTQCVLGVILATSSGPPAHVFELINRLDGVKMLVLAAGIASATLAPRESGLPARLAYLGVPTVVALVASGIGDLARDGALAGAAAASLPLLLLWVLSAGLTAADGACRFKPRSSRAFPCAAWSRGPGRRSPRSARSDPAA
jgi:hypothetical protein